ncbi:Single-stranded DNA-binding protein [Oligella sp. MSHR50489EDL]|uniref:single-stranded DNA-binding protein n=1 Tax=Oligella sp. MSHR50489EDL TaxID=3139409 RepID=UPI003D813249
MAYINEMTIMGYLGDKPELRYLNNGRVTTEISIATNEFWIDRHTGEKRARTTWHKVILWDKKAEVIANYMDKGDRLWVRGDLRVRSYMDKDGINRQVHEVHAREIKIIQTKRPAEDINDDTEGNNHEHAHDE